MVNCDVIRDLIPLYVDGVASEASRALVEEHTENCLACKEILTGMLHGNESIPIHVDDTEIGALKKMKRKITGKNIRVAIVTIVCVAVFAVAFFGHQTQMPYDAGKTRVNLAVDQVIDIYYDGNYSAAVAIQDGEDFYICYRGTLFTRLFSWGEDMHFAIGNSIAIDFGTNGQPIPISGEINRIYYMEGEYPEFALNKAEFDKAKENATLIWER
jgi:hypothetical protein